MKKKIIIGSIIGVILIGVVGYFVFQTIQPLKVVTVKIERSAYEDYYYEEGTVQSKEKIKVYSSATGEIEHIYIDEGVYVSEGDVILKIDQEDLNYQLDILYAQRAALEGERKSQGDQLKSSQINMQKEAITLATERVATLEKDLEREKILYENGASPKIAVERLEDTYNQAVGNLNIEEHRLTSLRQSAELGAGRAQYFEGQFDKIDLQIEQLILQMGELEVVAPMDGVISSFSLDIGEVITPNRMLFEIFEPKRFELETYVLAKEVRNFSIGSSVNIEIESQGATEIVEGQISSIAPNAIDLISPLGLVEKKVKVMVEPKEEVDLIQGETVDVKFITFSKEDAFVVPKDYVFPWMDGEGIWIIDDGKARVLLIEKELDVATVVIISNDLSEYEVIVPPYPDDIEEGMDVEGE